MKSGSYTKEQLEEENYQLREEIRRLRGVAFNLLKVCEDIAFTWDASDPTNIRPATHLGDLYPNDSLAAGSIVRAIEEYKKGK